MLNRYSRPEMALTSTSMVN